MFTRRGLNSGETEATSLLSREVKKTLAWRKKKKKETAKQEWRTVKEKEKRKFLLKGERGVINDLSAPLSFDRLMRMVLTIHESGVL